MNFLNYYPQVTIGLRIHMVLEDTLLYLSEISSTSSLATIIPAVLIPVAIIIACFVVLVIAIIFIFNRHAKRNENYLKDEIVVLSCKNSMFLVGPTSL